ncbi:hypothetical protein D026_3984A, partial [Vibrio parahaemolyticus 605]
MKLTEVF